MPGAGAHLKQASRALLPEQVKEATPLLRLELFFGPAVAQGRRAGPVRHPEASDHSLVLVVLLAFPHGPGSGLSHGLHPITGGGPSWVRDVTYQEVPGQNGERPRVMATLRSLTV